MVISHGCFSGSYNEFDGLRLVWADISGYGLYDFRNQGGPVMPRIEYHRYSKEDMLGEWPDGAPDDPLLILLLHDELSGRIKWTHAPYIADRLEELGELLLKADKMPWVLITQQFARGLRTAAAYKQDVMFSA